MDLLKNPFHILDATTRDGKIKIMDLAEDCRLLSDANECMDAQSTLIRPQNRIAAEIAWLPGVDPAHVDSLLKQLDSQHQDPPNIVDLPPLAGANFLIAKSSRLTNIASTNVLEWILAIAYASERIAPEEVRITLNEDRKISDFPQISDLSVITYGIQKQRDYYIDTLSSAIHNLSVTERARILTLTLETVLDNNNNRCPILIDDLIQSYEVEVGEDLEKKQNIIAAQEKKLRAMVDTKSPDSEFEPIVNQLIQAVKDWDTIAQPIQLSKRSTGERHTASFEIAWQVRSLAIDLFRDYNRSGKSLKILNTLKDIFAEVPEVRERIIEDLRELKGFEKFEVINTQVVKLKEVADTKKPDYTIAPIVTQLIKTVKTWNTSSQPSEANEVVANTVRGIAIYLWNEHQKAEFSLQITDTLLRVFSAIPTIVKLLAEDKKTLEKHAVIAKGLKKFEEIRKQIDSLQEVADSYKPDHTLYEMVNQLLQNVKTWDPSKQPFEANEVVAYSVRGIALHLCNNHKKLDFAIQITTNLKELFAGVHGMDEVNNKLNEDLLTLLAMKERRSRKGSTGCLLQIVIFGILGIVGALLQGC